MAGEGAAPAVEAQRRAFTGPTASAIRHAEAGAPGKEEI